jgi:hypothetical protein
MRTGKRRTHILLFGAGLALGLVLGVAIASGPRLLYDVRVLDTRGFAYSDTRPAAICEWDPACVEHAAIVEDAIAGRNGWHIVSRIQEPTGTVTTIRRARLWFLPP